MRARRVDLDMIFRNLLDNAVKYADDDPQVAVNCRLAAGETAVVSISDNGPGIPPKLRRKIFGRFVRLGLELERKKPGTGLGLYIVRTLVGRLRGSGAQRRCACPIHRADGRGRTFSVNLQGNAFTCFDSRCGKKGDVIDLWAALHQMDLRAAAVDLVRTFDLEATPAHPTEKRHG